MVMYPNQKMGSGRKTEPKSEISKKKEESPARTWIRPAVTERGSLTEVTRKSSKITLEKNQIFQFILELGREGSQGFPWCSWRRDRAMLRRPGVVGFDQLVTVTWMPGGFGLTCDNDGSAQLIDTIVVSCVQIMSNGMFKSPVHRVVTNSERERLTLAVFCLADSKMEIGLVEELIDRQRLRL
ncbi:hypothetical protein RHMOL_Rhmol05G0049400 [Rhododendron molle]|uniref:Uncharacterized protein n=1 Tax=Rhododendron molle TaxID=49168 RepID=A0ACC0NKZ6_RHOML|nr:hypothetical protein RHMOL_Rhmol05G0049400 [Rhododendron molle]